MTENTEGTYFVQIDDQSDFYCNEPLRIAKITIKPEIKMEEKPEETTLKEYPAEPEEISLSECHAETTKMGMMDIIVTEGDTGTFVCKLKAPSDTVEWYKGDGISPNNLLNANDRIIMHKSSDLKVKFDEKFVS
jgi:hypothetical protein